MAEPVDRKVWTQAISGTSVSVIATFGIVTYFRKRGVEIPPEVASEITGVIGGAIGFITGWLIPMAASEIKAHLGRRPDANEIVKEAQEDPKSNVDLTRIIDDKLIAQAQLNPASPATMPEGETPHSLNERLDNIAVAEARSDKEANDANKDKANG